MPRHPGLQHEMRLKEIATAIAIHGGNVQESFRRLRQLEEEAAILKATAEVEQQKLNAVLKLQAELIESQRWTEFGLPSGMTTAYFAQITGHEITS